MRTAPGNDGRLSFACGSAVVVLVAAAAAVDPWGFRPFTTVRWAIVGAAAAAAAAATRWRPPGRPPGRLLAAWAGLLAWLAVATVTSVDPLIAVVGHPRRHLGLAGWVVCALAFAAGTGLSAVDVRRYVGRAAVVAAALTGAGALADLAGWDPPGATFAGGRVGGLLGQPLYLGALAALLTPVAVGVAADATAGLWWRRAAAVAAGSSAAAVLASQTRGAWVGLAVAAVVAWPAIRGWAVSHRPVVATGVVVLASLAVVGPLGSRAVEGFEPVTGTGQGRLDEWSVAASIVADHPVTGVGPEGYRVAAPGHIDDHYARLHGRDEVIDRAHNGPLDVAASAGLPGAVAYVALLAAVVACCLRAVRRPPDPVVVGAAVGVVAWVVQQAVSFPIAEIDPVAWLLAGAVAVAVPSRSPETPVPAEPAPAVGDTADPARDASRPVVDSSRRTRWSWWRWVAVPRAFAGGLAGVLAIGGVLAVSADRELHRAESGAAVSEGAAALAAADRATTRRPDDIDAWYVAARVATRARPGLLGVDAGLDRVEDGLRRASRHDPALRSLQEELLVERALRSGLPADLRAAQSAAEALVADDPAGPAHHRYLGLVLVARGRAERAAAELRRALDLDPDDAVARGALDDLAVRAAT